MQKSLGILLFTISVFACTSSRNLPKHIDGTTQISYYGDGFNGRKTANGEIFDNNKFTAAHRSLSFGTKVLLTNPKTGNTVSVTINDRGSLKKGREFDVTKAAFKKLGNLREGVLTVKYQILQP